MARVWNVGATLTLAIVATLVPPTQAQPRVSVWQRVKNPSLPVQQFVRQFADHKREPRDFEHDTEAIRTQLHKAAAAWLERVVGSKLDTSEDRDLLFLYGECLAYAGPDSLDRAEQVLLRALSLGPDDDPATASAWNTLGRVQAARGNTMQADAAFERALNFEWDAPTRSGIQIEQGFLAMGEGQLTRAIERLASARDGTHEPALWSLSQWALGVAMDRALLGPEGASLAWEASQARFGGSGELDVLALPGMAPEPPAEATYYRALALMGKASRLPTDERVKALLEAKFLWLGYIREAGPTAPSVGRAFQHLKRIDDVTRTPEDDADLERQARAPMQLEFDAGQARSEAMIWPEELVQGSAFWGGDAGSGGDPAPQE
jgi:hypothetical protein